MRRSLNPLLKKAANGAHFDTSKSSPASRRRGFEQSTVRICLSESAVVICFNSGPSIYIAFLYVEGFNPGVYIFTAVPYLSHSLIIMGKSSPC